MTQEKEVTFKADTFNGLTDQLDRYIDDDQRYLTVKKIEVKRVDNDETRDYYWTGTITF